MLIEFKYGKKVYNVDTILPQVGDIVETVFYANTFVKVIEIKSPTVFVFVNCDSTGNLIEQYKEHQEWDITTYPITTTTFADGCGWNRIVPCAS